MKSKQKNLISIYTLLIIIFSISTFAGDPFRVDENIEMGTKDIYNATNINATYFFGDGSGLNNVITTFSNLSNSSTYWSGLIDYSGFYFVDTSSILSFNSSSLYADYLFLNGTNGPITGRINIVIDSSDTDLDILNITNENTLGVSSYRAENNRNSSIQMGVFGESISQALFPGQIGVNDDALGITGEGGPIWISAQGNKKILLGGTPDSNLSNSNFSISINPNLQSLEFQGNKFIVPIRIDGGYGLATFANESLIAGGIPFSDIARDSNGDIVITSAQQNGKNNSFSFNMNSYGSIPKSWILSNIPNNASIFDYTANGNDTAEFIFNITSYIEYCSYLQNNLSLVNEGCKYFADTTGRLVPLLFTGDLEVHRSAVIHEGIQVYDNFNYIDRDNDPFDLLWTDLNNGSFLRIRDDRTIEANISLFDQTIADFEDGSISPLVSESISPIPGRDWTNIQAYTECHDNLCSRAQGGGSVKSMTLTDDTTFLGGTIAATDIYLQLYFSSQLGISDNFSIIIDDRIGNITTLFSTNGDFSDQFLNLSLPSIYENKSDVKTYFNLTAATVGREVFIDDIKIIATPAENIIINETYRGGKIVLGNDDCYIETKRVINNLTQETESQTEIVCDLIKLSGNVTQEKTTIVSTNATGNIEAENLISRNNVSGNEFYRAGTEINSLYYRIDGSNGPTTNDFEIKLISPDLFITDNSASTDQKTFGFRSESGDLYFNSWNDAKSVATAHLVLDHTTGEFITRNISPQTDNLSSLGSSSNKWKETHSYSFYRDGTEIDNLYYRKDGSNSPITGDTEISLISPDFYITDTSGISNEKTFGFRSELGNLYITAWNDAKNVSESHIYIDHVTGQSNTKNITPQSSNVYFLGDSSNRWKEIYSYNLSGNLSYDNLYNFPAECSEGEFLTELNGTCKAPTGGSGDLWSDPVNSDIIPDTDNSRNLGNSSNGFVRLYVDTAIEHVGTVGQKIAINTNQFNFVLQNPGGTVLALEQTKVTVNDGANDVDFRVRGDITSDLLFVNAGTNKVGIGTDTPSEELDIQGGISVSDLSGTYGSGSAYVCVYDNGTMFSSDSACP